MKPKKIEIKNSNLVIEWNNESKSAVSLKYLRDECPCAGCKGETVLFKTYRSPERKIITPGTYKIKDIKIVGGYAIQIFWEDGHDTGIYSWAYLHDLEKGQNNNSPQNYKDL